MTNVLENVSPGPNADVAMDFFCANGHLEVNGY
jgi:hypothetical protein